MSEDNLMVSSDSFIGQFLYYFSILEAYIGEAVSHQSKQMVIWKSNVWRVGEVLNQDRADLISYLYFNDPNTL